MAKDTGKKLADMMYGQPFDVPTPENLRLGQQLIEQQVREKAARDAKLTPLDKAKAAYEAARMMGSAAVASLGSIPTRISKGSDAGDQYVAERVFIPTTEKGLDYVENVGNFLEQLESKYKIPPILPQVYGTEALIGAAARQGKAAAKRGALQAGMRLERGMEPIVNRAMESGGLPREMVMAMGANTQSNVVKPEGGNWLKGAVKRGVSGLKVHERTPGINGHTEADQAVDVALNKWIDSNLANYLQKQMGTPSDPIRKLADEGIIHMTDIDTYGVGTPTHTGKVRRKAGFPESGMAETQMGKRWENASDSGIASIRAGDIQAVPALEAKADESNRLYSEASAKMRAGLRKRLEDRGMSEREIEAFSRMRDSDIAQIMGDDNLLRLRDEASTDAARVDTTNKVIASENPWISKLDPEENVYYGGVYDLGFDHVMDVLREDLATGRIRPEQLNKVSIEQAVRRTHEYNKEMAAKAAAAKAAAREGLPVYKEYPEGFRWVELNKPGSFASESESMGHSVRGYEPPKGHPDWIEGSGDSGSSGYGHGGWESIKSGKAKVYSLVDPKGEPHVTVEVGPNDYLDFNSWFEKQPKELRDEINARARRGEHNMSIFEAPEYLAAREALPPRITQIKGKVNRAPKDEYLPFVQDFVRSGQWSDVGDLQNTGLRRTSDAFNETERAFLRSQGVELKPYIEPEETARYQEMFKRTPEVPSEDGMAHGGRVHISDNPDVMQLELAGGGGVLSKMAKLARASAKSKQEIEAIAERMAPQVTGEYVRKKPGSAVTVADKTKKQFEREKNLPVDVRAINEERIPQPVDIEKLKGEVMIGIPGDPTITGKTLHGVGDVRLESPAPQHGGPLYGLYHDDDHFWASGLGAARRVQNLAKEAGEQYDAPVIGKYIMMGPESINYAQHFADANLQAIDLSKMTKKQIEGFNKIIRQGSPASGPRPSFPGIEDKESAYLHMAMDPELRKHFNALMQQNTVTEAFNLPSGQDIRFAITEGPLRDLETGVTGYSMGRMRPDIPSSELKLSEHPTYSHDIPGEFLGQSKYPIPYELSFPDTLKSIRENPKQAGHEFGSLKMVGPRQTIDQQLIDEIKMYEERMKALTGKKKGGAVRKAAGGDITADDLILEERKL